METLTKQEERIMQILWNIKRGVVRDVLNKLPEPRPPYTTISSVIRILEKKGFVGYKAYGKTHEYFPLITKIAYKKHLFKNFISNYFEGSYQNVVSFMVNDEEISEEDKKEILREIKKTENKN